jgi:hypothetical protein
MYRVIRDLLPLLRGRRTAQGISNIVVELPLPAISTKAKLARRTADRIATVINGDAEFTEASRSPALEYRMPLYHGHVQLLLLLVRLEGNSRRSNSRCSWLLAQFRSSDGNGEIPL